LSMYLLKS